MPRQARPADNPGRNEPGACEINFGFLFEHLDRIGHQGWIGCEYRPATTTEAGLGWLERARRQRPSAIDINKEST